MQELTITLPLPPKELSPNTRVHWGTKARAVKNYRYAAGKGAWLAMRAAGFSGPWGAATVEATFYFRDKRRRDKDNHAASLKPAFDGLADAGLIGNDECVTPLPPVLAVDRKSPRVELVVRRTA